MDLPVDVYSPDQLSELLLQLQDVASVVRGVAARKQTEQEPITLSPELEQLLTINKISVDDAAALDALGKEIQTTLDRAPAVHVLLAAMPGRVIRRQLVTWFRTQVNPLTLLTFAARSDLGGGAIVQAGSHLYDLSFRRSIIDNKKRLTEIAGV
jgi:hypothetical protein